MKILQTVTGRASAQSARTILLTIGCLAFAGPLLSQQPAAAAKSAGDPNKLYLQGELPLSVSYAGAPAAVAALASGQLKPLALASGDLDGDGVDDLIAGYASANGGVLVIHRGNLDAFAPQSQASWQAIAEGRFPSPFLPQAKVIELPEAPDFLILGNFMGEGHLDVAVAARGSHTLYILANDGKGGLLAPQSIALSGALSALGSTHFDGGTAYSHIVAGTSGQIGSQLTVLEATAVGINVIATAPLRGPPTSLAFGGLWGDAFPDVAVVAGGELQIVHGGNVHAASAGEGPATLQAESVSIPFVAASVAVGSFIQDRASRLQMAVLGTDGSVHIVTRAGLDTRPWSLAEMQSRRRALLDHKPDPLAVPVDPAEGWQVAESFPAVVSTANPSQPPVLFRTRISSRGADDVMILDSNLAQMHVFGHERMSDSGTSASNLPASFHFTLAMNASGATVAGIPMRVNIDGRPGVVVLKQGQMAPQVMMPLPDPTFVVNRTDDPTPVSPITNACNTPVSTDCSLREAVLRANALAGTDTIMVPAGTFTLTIARAASPAYDATTGTLNINDSVNIVGAGQNTTIIQAGTLGDSTGTPNGVDMVMAVNEDIPPLLTNATASISNLTLQNGHNLGNDSTIGDGDGGCMEFDTGSSGTATLTLTNVTFNNCDTTQGGGGGLVIFNFTNPGTGFATITNSIFQNNSAVDGASSAGAVGGGIEVTNNTQMVMTNSQVINNKATQAGGVGGGIWIFGPSGSARTAIHASTISGNQSASDGAGIWATQGVLIDQKTVISNNVAGGQGGGIWANALSPETVTLSKVTITGNSAAGSGGGIALFNISGTANLTIGFSRLAGNIAPSGSNLSNAGGTVIATNNWWGTNSAAGTINIVGGFTTTFDPFIVLTNVASPNLIRIADTSTVTASFLQDNLGTPIAVSNLDVLLGLPLPPQSPLTIFPDSPVHGTLSGVQTTIQPNGQATETFTATSGGIETIHAVIDQASVPATITVLFPPSISKAFSATHIPVFTISPITTTLTFTITNPNTANALHGLAFTDNLPSGLAVANTPNVVNGCGGTVTAAAGTGVITLSGGTVNQNTNCTVAVDVKGVSDGVQNNTTSTVTATDASGLTGNTASASITVINPPHIVKAFGSASIPLGATTSLTFTVSSTNASLPSNGVAFTDSLPAGVIVATPNGLSSNCGGAAIAAAGGSSVSLLGATLGAGASCTVSLNVQGITVGVANNSVTVSDTTAGTGNTSNATITVVGPPVIIKAFGAASIPLNGSTSLSFTIQNNNTTQALSGIGFSDTLPAGLVIATPNGQVGICAAGTITATPGTNVVSLTGAALAQSTSCTFSVNVTGTSAGQKNNTTGAVTSTEGGAGGTASASLIVVAPPVIAKAFNPTTIALNATTTLTFTVANPAANTVAETGVAFTDTLPAGLVVSTPNGLLNTCTGTVTAVAGSTGISLTGGSVAANASCTVVVNVTGTISGQYTNTSGAVSSTNGGTGNTATANLTVASPPTITKAFGAATIPLNGTTSLTFNISNPNAAVTLTGIAFTDNLPAGLVVATPNNLNSTCGGTATAVSGAGSASLLGATLAASASCTVSLNVQGTTAGVKNNSVQITSTEGGTGNTSNASVTVVSPPVIIKAFGAASIPLNGSTSLTFTIQNNNTTQTLSGVGFSDILPAGLVISTPNGQVGTCGAGTITATAGTNVISLTGAVLAVSSSCTFSVNVTGAAAGTQNNTTGNVTSTEGGTGGTASASINVAAPPSIAKAFGVAAIPLNGTTSLTLTVTNPAANAVAETGVAFTDTLPAGIVVATPNGTTNTCGGTATAVAGSGSITLTGGTIATGSNCAVHVNVTGTASGNFTNTTGSVTSTNGGTGNTATANLTVASPPTITKAFGAATIPLNGATSLTFNISNPNAAVTLTGIAFTDNLPAGLVVATPNNLNSTCGGTATAVSGAGSASLLGGTLAASASCTVSLNVQGTTAGVKNNSVQVASTEGGTGNTSNASITVVGPPVIIKAFGAASIPLNGSTSLTFTIQNNNTAQTLSGVGFSDTLPAGLVISTPNGQVGTCGAGTITATAGTNVISLTGAAIAVSSSCTFLVNVTGAAAGTQNNTTGNVTSTEGGTGGTASASINVAAPPSIAKAFGVAAIPLNGTTSLTLTVTNPAANAVAETGVAFTDTLPAGIVVATPNGTTNTCGGTATAVAGSGSITLTGGTIATGSNCAVHVNVTGTASGNFTNTTGSVTSTNGGTGNTASANLTVATPPTITKAFGAARISLNGTTSLTFNITNPNTNVPLSGVAFTDNLPAGLAIATPNGLAGTCGAGTITATAGGGAVSLSGGTLTASPAAGSSCTFSVNVTGTMVGVKNNSVQVTSIEAGTGNTSNASVTVVSPPVIIKAFGAASIPLNGSTSLTFTIQNNNTTQSLSGVGFTDTLPAGLVIATPNGLAGTCGAGTITATPGTNVISLTGAALAVSSSCTFSVSVTGTAAGTQNNTTGAVTSTEGGTGGTASASLAVVAPPSIAKAFNPTAVALNATTTLTFTITNPAANAVAEIGVVFSDAFPAGIVVATPNGLTNTCAGTATAVAGSGSVSLTGGTVAVSSNCTLTVNVTGTVSGNYTNTTGAVSSTNGGTGNTATANVTVASPPVITKTFGAITLPLTGSTSLSFTISNPVANAVALTGVAFTDSLPAGLVVSTPNALTGACGGGTITALAGSPTVSLAGATLATSSSCTFSVNVTAVTGGVKNNSVQVTSANGGTGNTSSATVTATTAPVITKTFGAASIPLNGSTSLSFTIQNNNATQSLSGVSFTDALPAGMAVSTPNGLAGTCGAGTITATQGTGAISLTGATLAASGSCTFAVNVTGIAAGTENNTTGNVTSTEGGAGGTASASIVVVAPPSIVKAFNPTAVSPNGNSTLSFTITNPAANTAALAGVAFTDTLPAGITVATPNGLAGSCGGGTITGTAGSGAVSLTGATIAAGTSCTFSVSVTGANAGVSTNTTGAVTSTNGGTGNTATANLTVATPPSITKAFGAASIGLAGSTSLTFTVSNPNASIALAGVAFTDALPAGLVVSTPNGLTGTCGAGTITAAAGSTSVTLAGGTIATSGTCSFAVNVTGVAAGNQVNITGTVSATNGGTGNTATASINVLAPDLTITKSHSGNFFQGETGATYAVTVNNIGPGPTAGTVTVTDTLPAGLTATAMTGTGWTCTVATLTCTRTDALASGASYPPITLTVSVAANAAASVTNIATVAGGGEINTANDTAMDITTITIPPDFTLAVTPASITIRAGQAAQYGITVTPINNAFTNPIDFTVTGLPGRTSFVFSPASVTPGLNPATSTLKILTTPGDPFLAQNSERTRLPLYAMFLPFAGLVLSGIGFGKRRLARKWVLAVAIFVCSGLAFYGCASAGNFQKLGTPPGTYTVTVTATSGNLQHSAPVTLVVTP